MFSTSLNNCQTSHHTCNGSINLFWPQQLQPSISHSCFLHLLHEHSLNRWIYQKDLLSSDLESKFLAFNTQTYCPMPNIGDNKSLSQFFKIKTEFESSWELFQVDIFTCMSQNGIGAVVHTCAANVGSTKEELSSMRGFILICRMNFLTWLFHRGLLLKSIIQLDCKNTLTMHGVGIQFAVFPYVTHTVVHRSDISL